MLGSAAHKPFIYFRFGLHTVYEVKSLISISHSRYFYWTNWKGLRKGKEPNNMVLDMGRNCGLNK